MKKLILVITFLLFCSTAQATIIDFESLRQDDAAIHSLPLAGAYNEDGMTLTPLPNHQGNIGEFNSFGTLSKFFPGSTSFFLGRAEAEIMLTKTNEGIFDLTSIDLADLPPGDDFGDPVDLGIFDIAFFGTKQDSSSVSHTITLDTFLTLKTFTFTGFTDLISVNWFQGAGGVSSPTHQFDNIVVDYNSEPIPEPSTWLLLGIGLILIAVIEIRKRQSLVTRSDNIT